MEGAGTLARHPPRPAEGGPVLIAGATGFVGRRLLAALRRAGLPTRGLSRSADVRGRPAADGWVVGDVADANALGAAMNGCRAAYYLVHGVGSGEAYDVDEVAEADLFARVATASGLERIVYLGGVAPQGPPSRHLRARLMVGEHLRRGPVPCLELRASMIVGYGSASWTMVRDLAGRLPMMLLPRWLENRSQPIGVDDVVRALVAALEFPLPESTFWDLAGPQALSGRELLAQSARLLGLRPVLIGVPLVTPRLSSYWIRFVTRVPPALSRELVEGLRTDLLPVRTGYFAAAGLPEPATFEVAARLALAEERLAGERAA